MKTRLVASFLLTPLVACSVLLESVRAQDFYGIDFNGDLVRVNSQLGTTEFIGTVDTGPFGMQWAALEHGPDGRLYGMTHDSPSALYEIDPLASTATLVATLDSFSFLFEGGLAIAPTGKAYGANFGSSTSVTIFELDLATGAVTLIGLLAGPERDLNGLAWRTDGKLIAIDRPSNSLLEIDPSDATFEVVQQLTPTLGSQGGLVITGGVAYFATAGPSSSNPGPNEIWAVDAFGGNEYFVADVDDSPVPDGLAGLAIAGPILSAPENAIAGAVNTLRVKGLAPGAPVAFFFSNSLGLTPLQGTCDGLALDLGGPGAVSFSSAGGSGIARLEQFVPAGLAGITVYAQCVDLDACAVGNAVAINLN